jgi:hypothetical protein
VERRRADERLHIDWHADQHGAIHADLQHYETLTSYVQQHASGAQTIVNFGTMPSESETNAGDIAVTFEDNYSNYLSATVPSWVYQFPPQRFYDIVYGVPGQSAMTTVRGEAASDNVGYVYVTSSPPTTRPS